MKLKGLNGMTIAQVQDEVARGGRFVRYNWCLSLLVVTFRYQSAIYFIRSHENAFLKGLPFSAASFLLGWWGIPYGAFYTMNALYKNINGNCMTAFVLKQLHHQTHGHVFEFEATQDVAFAL
jgi:hypothetical protein